VLCPVRRPTTTLDCVLLKDSTRALLARLGPEISSRICLCVLQGPRHNIRCWFSIQRLIFLLIFCLETPKKGTGPKTFDQKPSLASLPVISFPRTPACPRNPIQPHSVPGKDVVQRLSWHCRTKRDVVLAAWSAFRAPKGRINLRCHQTLKELGEFWWAN
jgi:hypothetical protein